MKKTNSKQLNFIGLARILILTGIIFFAHQCNKLYYDKPVFPVGVKADKYVSWLRWNFEGHKHQMDLKAPTSYYHYYNNKPKNMPYACYTEESDSFPFTNYLVQNFYLTTAPYHYDSTQLAACALSCVQSLGYTSDPQVPGDYPRFPIETVMEHMADCEDASALLFAIYSRMGKPVKLVQFPKHQMVLVGGVAPKGVKPFMQLFGVDYYSAEATGNSRLGVFDPKYRLQQLTVL